MTANHSLKHKPPMYEDIYMYRDSFAHPSIYRQHVTQYMVSQYTLSIYSCQKETPHRHTPFRELHVENEGIPHKKETWVSKRCAKNLTTSRLLSIHYQMAACKIGDRFWICLYYVAFLFYVSLLTKILAVLKHIFTWQGNLNSLCILPFLLIDLCMAPIL